MFSVRLRINHHDPDQVIAKLWEHYTLGIIEQTSNQVLVFFEFEQNIPEFESAEAEVLELRNDDTAQLHTFSRDAWDPILIGNRFFIAPPWVHAPTPPERIRLVIDSGPAFGTGRHESTQLALIALERYVQPEHTVLDVGCGSGILSAAAFALGARHVFGCDTDALAVSAAQLQNVGSAFFVGTCDAVKSGIADIVLANISARVIDQLAFELHRVTKPDGLIILAGFIKHEPPSRFRPRERLEDADWECWVCPRTHVSEQIQPEPLQPFPQLWW